MRIPFILLLLCSMPYRLWAQAKQPFVELKKAGLTTIIVEGGNTHDFGTVNAGPTVYYSYEFKNTGPVPLIIRTVMCSCGCCVGDWPKEPIAPGKTGIIKVAMTTRGHNGPFSHTLAVMGNLDVPEGRYTLHILGKVKPVPDFAFIAGSNICNIGNISIADSDRVMTFDSIKVVNHGNASAILLDTGRKENGYTAYCPEQPVKPGDTATIYVSAWMDVVGKQPPGPFQYPLAVSYYGIQHPCDIKSFRIVVKGNLLPGSTGRQHKPAK